MRKLLQCVLTAIIICGLAVFNACTNEDNSVKPVENLSEKIIGKWMPADKDGQPMITNKKMVITFTSSTKAYMSASLSAHPEVGTFWGVHLEGDVVISGNKIIVTAQADENKTVVHDFIITDITDKEFSAKHEVTYTIENKVVLSIEDEVRYVKVIADYKEDVLGLWECTGLTGIETYNDANARLEFLSDGTYRYYRQDDNGQWQTVTTREFQDYFVDGTLLATRWKDKDEDELREWWEIESLSSNEMAWTALRQNADGTTVQQKMTWKKIDLNISENIIGKWIQIESDGEPIATDSKTVTTFLSDTKATISMSKSNYTETSSKYGAKSEFEVQIDGNKVTLTSQTSKMTTLINELNIFAINSDEILCIYNRKAIRNGEVVNMTENQQRRYIKITSDYSADIIGTWEGRCTSEGSIFDDGQEHRWQYNADGTYVYYVKDGDNWVPYEGNTLNEYFVDGTLLCTRWIDQGQENREWWEISIDGDKMNWTALRQKEDGTTFTATFEMKKVE